MYSYMTTVIFRFFAPGILFCVFFGCDNAPRVRLVKDNDYTFHLQWDKPLKEERIVLVRCSVERGIHLNGKWEKSYNHSRDYLVYFPEGSFISGTVEDGRWRSFDSELDRIFTGKPPTDKPQYEDRINSVELLAHHLRNTISFPVRLHVIKDEDFIIHGDQVILRDHPFFQEYRVGEPSRLTFDFSND